MVKVRVALVIPAVGAVCELFIYFQSSMLVYVPVSAGDDAGYNPTQSPILAGPFETVTVAVAPGASDAGDAEIEAEPGVGVGVGVGLPPPQFPDTTQDMAAFNASISAPKSLPSVPAFL